MSSGEGWSATATVRPVSSTFIGNHEVLACDGVGNACQRFGFRLGLTEVDGGQPGNLGAGFGQVVFVEHPMAHEQVSEVGPGWVGREHLVDLLLAQEVAPNQHMLHLLRGLRVQLQRCNLSCGTHFRCSIRSGWELASTLPPCGPCDGRLDG